MRSYVRRGVNRQATVDRPQILNGGLGRLSINVASVLAALVVVTGCAGSDQSEGETVASAEHNRVDVMFAQMMVPHHDDAIAMADYLQGVPGVDPRVEKLASGIVTAQENENEQMNTWLAERGYPQVDDAAAQIDEDAVTAEGASRAQEQFLTEMIAHHEHGVDMAEGAVTRGKSPEMTSLAQGMVDDQSREIDLMRDLLAEG